MLIAWQAVAFLHGHEESWHSCNMRDTLRGLHWRQVPGYVDINRKMGYWERPLGALAPHPDALAVIATGADVHNGSFHAGQIIEGKAYDFWEAYLWQQRKAARQIYADFLEPEGLGPMPDYVKFYCCSQMVVTQDAIYAHDRDFYKRFLLYLGNNRIQSNHRNSKRYALGDGINYFWSTLFGFSPANARVQDKLFEAPLCH